MIMKTALIGNRSTENVGWNSNTSELHWGRSQFEIQTGWGLFFWGFFSLPQVFQANSATRIQIKSLISSSTSFQIHYSLTTSPLSLATGNYFVTRNKCVSFLDAFAILRKATIRFIMSVRLSIGCHGITRLPIDGFSWNLIFEYFSKIYRENSSFNKIWQ